jgi:aminopeptidase 2
LYNVSSLNVNICKRATIVQARRAFPGFDEPAHKATFSISMISRTGTTSLANTDVKETKHIGAGGDFPRTELLTESFFKENTAVNGKTEGKVEGKTEGKTEGKIEGATSTGDDVEPKQSADGKSVSVSDEFKKRMWTLAQYKDDWEIVHFSKTPKVSTYLVAWANGEFE